MAQNERLAIGVADVEVGVVDQEDAPLPLRAYLELGLRVAVEFEHDAAGALRGEEAHNLFAVPDVHGGLSETSVMLVLIPDLVRRERVERAAASPDAAMIKALIFDRGASFPWRTDDPRLGHAGIIGDARAASPQLGQAIIDSVVAEARGVLVRLLENQKLMG